MITPATQVITLLLVILTLAVPRRYFLAPYILAACFVPADQRIIIFDLNFTPLRILVVAGYLRLLLRGEKITISLNHFDKLALALPIKKYLTINQCPQWL